MPTFLELCQQFHEEVGMAGTISSVTGQSGMLKRMVNWIAKADRKIQGRKENWNFLWAQWELTLTSDGDYGPPDSIGMFDQDSFWIKAGTVDAYKLTWVDYTDWRNNLKNSYLDASEPSFVTILPSGRVAILPTPNTDYVGETLTCDYWKAPTKLQSNTQVSAIPEKFHDAIVEQAKMYHAAFRHDNGAYADAYNAHEAIYRDLKAHSLPGNSEDNKSQASIPMVIEVE